MVPDRPKTAGLTGSVFSLLLGPQAVSKQRGPTHLDTQRRQEEWRSGSTAALRCEDVGAHQAEVRECCEGPGLSQLCVYKRSNASHLNNQTKVTLL